MNKDKKIVGAIIIVVIICVFVGSINFSNTKSKELININIGYQSITAQTWGALIIRNQKIFEDKLKVRYPDYEFNVQWYNEVSGAVINNNMLAHKYQIGYMGDMPAIINLYNGYSQEKFTSTMIACDGRGKSGKNQSILVSKESGIDSIENLKGKTISVPIGSSAHHMLLKILEQNDLLDEVEILHQDIPTAYNMIVAGKVNALAAWEPYPILMENDGLMEKLIDGEESGIDYLTGIMVDTEWANKNKDIIEIFLESVLESHEFLRKNREESIKIICEESGFTPDVVSKTIDNIEWDAEITTSDLDTFQRDYEFLFNIGQINEFPVLENINIELVKKLKNRE